MTDSPGTNQGTVADTYGNFRELAGAEKEGEAWTREYLDRGSRILVMAPHGGWIEPFTSELAEAVAGPDLSFYTFRAVMRGENQRLHLTSHRFDDPLALKAVEGGFAIRRPRRGLAGRHPKNICNRGRLGPGVQLEISEALRRELREYPARKKEFVKVVRHSTLFMEERGAS